jgi:hypothetical protein
MARRALTRDGSILTFIRTPMQTPEHFQKRFSGLHSLLSVGKPYFIVIPTGGTALFAVTQRRNPLLPFSVPATSFA